jgi:hypothetical protein|nr:MAG TPA: hypothetical protein [Bacteriophage sp.]
MTVYELIQRLTEFPSDAEVDFELQKSFGWPAVVDTDEGTRLVTANVSLNERLDIENFHFYRHNDDSSTLYIHFNF